ncbi:MAG TPA: TetR/AcrR family transcriptional regulator [Kofleriaceae bacterium]|nr:TetR/AcrR family transcriptional regulator [Kofleriaceae bacterium]
MPIKKKPPKKPRKPAEKKSEATRRQLLEHALALFQERGVAATTMRDIASAAGLSLGAAYYYFPSKDALMFAYYEDNQQSLEEIAMRAHGTLRERLGTLMHGKLESIRPHRAMLGAIVARLVDPGDPVGAFSAQTRAVRERSIAIFHQQLADSGLPPPTMMLVAHALWLLQMAAMLVYVNDPTPHATRTHGLVNDGLDLLVPLLPLLGTPPGQAICDRVTSALLRAGLVIPAST